ncbi:MAG TPA: serine/threonine-protein kinase, partial [Polyangiaceae bacterium]|nr:serine/threonine-protein kinase [Polyangiaceae bacterium]
MPAAPAPSSIPVGTVLADKYRVTREIGRGGMAAVYEAQNVDIGKRVAVKVLNPELTHSTVVIERFLREARAAASVNSPYICDVYDAGKLEDGRPFLVLELLEGESLYDRMVKVRRFDPPMVSRIFTQIGRGLTKAHEASIIHRDLKPENIFLTQGDDGEVIAKILDFGLAKFYEPVAGSDQVQHRLTREGAIFGTPAYMSPEQVKGQGAVDHRADLWALGCMVFECLIGRTVWTTDQGVAMIFAQVATAPLPVPSRLRKDLPIAFDRWFAKSLQRDPAKRFQSARELADELAASFTEQSVRASSADRPRPPPPPRLPRPSSPQPDLGPATPPPAPLSRPSSPR